jgi:hypothetical protein
LTKFNDRNGISHKSICEVSAAVDTVLAEDWMQNVLVQSKDMRRRIYPERTPSSIAYEANKQAWIMDDIIHR